MSSKNTNIQHLFRSSALSLTAKDKLFSEAKTIIPTLTEINSEWCFNIEVSGALNTDEISRLEWLLSETFNEKAFQKDTFLSISKGSILEVGPRLTFSTAWSTNAINICKSSELDKISRIERSRRYQFQKSNSLELTSDERGMVLPLLYDRMTECQYTKKLESFALDVLPVEVFTIPLLEEGREALYKVGQKLGLGYDDQDLDYYTKLFRDDLKRNPTSVECFDLAQGNSEHSRHWFFNGKMVIDGKAKESTLFQLVKKPWKQNPGNSTLAFCDNSSALRGPKEGAKVLMPTAPGVAGSMSAKQVDWDVTFTAETHNFPCGIAPFPGAETGTGGRIRDGQSAGRGSLVVAGTAAYCVGNLNIPETPLPYEDKTFHYPSNMAKPLDILVQASNGASDYGNKFGEPLIQGYTRSYGMRHKNGERREWVKPIMFSGGIGMMDHTHLKKYEPQVGMLVVKIGGPAYRIGLGGGAASSMVAGDNQSELDFNAVQRGDAEMEQKMNRVIRACVELGERNPIVSIHDQGAGGTGNVLKEIAEPAGAWIDLRKMLCGDPTMSILELWGAEFQENNALLIKKEDLPEFERMCKRERCPFAVVGKITGDGRVVVWDSKTDTTPVDLPLDKVLSSMPQKTFMSETIKHDLGEIEIPSDMTIQKALSLVLTNVAVGSKRFLTNKVDRSVTGLIAQQQCVGPLHTPLADCAVIALGHFSTTGAACSIGEQPIKGIIDPAIMARLAVAEALTNIVWANLTSLEDVKTEGNWMWAAKLEGEGSKMYAAAEATCDFMCDLGIAIDGGKDSLSMACRVPGAAGEVETVKCPGELTISAYCTVKDIRKTVTPDLKLGEDGLLLWLPVNEISNQLGGTIFAQVLGQIGSSVSDVKAAPLKKLFNVIQKLVEEEMISAGHDISDGGLLVTLLEMAFAGNSGVSLDFPKVDGVPNFNLLFSESPGVVIEVHKDLIMKVEGVFKADGVDFKSIGMGMSEDVVTVAVGGSPVFETKMTMLRDEWESTSYALEMRQCAPKCVDQARDGLKDRKSPAYKLTFDPKPTAEDIMSREKKFKVAVIREEGSNGDREMCAAFYDAGFDVHDVMMTDIIDERVKLSEFRGLAFVGGFSYADVLDSSKGWAAAIRFNEKLKAQFNDFYRRKDTFSLGVCNGCQLMALLGWVPGGGESLPAAAQPRFIHNTSERFESRFSTVTINSSPSIMLKGMSGSTLGVWIAHGEGHAFFPDESILTKIKEGKLIPMQYADDNGSPTEVYPFNPNGSPHGIAGLCTSDGRHLALMPHPERVFKNWQWPWQPAEWKNLKASPWLTMFQNAREWCENSSE